MSIVPDTRTSIAEPDELRTATEPTNASSWTLKASELALSPNGQTPKSSNVPRRRTASIAASVTYVTTVAVTRS